MNRCNAYSLLPKDIKYTEIVLKDNSDENYYPSYYESGMDDTSKIQEGYYLTNSYLAIVNVDSGYLFKRSIYYYNMKIEEPCIYYILFILL